MTPYKTICTLLIAVTFIACKSNKSQQPIDKNSYSTSTNSNLSIKDVINEKPILVLEQCKEVLIFDIQKTTVGKSEEEVSNKLVLKKLRELVRIIESFFKVKQQIILK
mgnify:CR=1 FL=1